MTLSAVAIAPNCTATAMKEQATHILWPWQEGSEMAVLKLQMDPAVGIDAMSRT